MSSDRDKRTRVVRRGPYTKQNRKQLRHHLEVGAGVGGSVGAAAGAHLGAYIHSSETHRMMRAQSQFAKLPPRGKVALAVAGMAGTLGALQGASIGHDVARMQRHKAKHAMAKAAHPHADEAAATALGAGASQGAYQGAGYGTKHWVDHRTRKGFGASTTEVNRKDKILRPNKSKYGMRLPQGHPDRDNVGYHRNYPKQLPHSGKIRALGYTHEGRLGVATGATVTAIGGAAALAEAHHRVKKSEPLAIAGKLWRKPTKLAEFKRAFGGTRKGEKLVDRAHKTPKVTHSRNAYGYPERTFTGQTHGPEVKAGFKAYSAHHASYSPHRTSFKAGAATARATAAVGRRPEYAISVPATGVGVGIVHHETKGKKKGTPVTKSAFGVEIRKDVMAASSGKPTFGRKLATIVATPVHGLVAGRKGDKLAASGSELGHTLAGGVIGRAAGLGLDAATHGALGSGGVRAITQGAAISGAGRAAEVNNMRGRYKPQQVAKTVSEQQRMKLAGKKHPQAQPDGSFPVGDKKHAKAALMDIRFAPTGRRASIRAQAHRELAKSAFGVAKKYQAGTITYHQHAADIHSRKKSSGRKQAAAGVAGASGGIAMHLNADRLARAGADSTSMRGTSQHVSNVKQLRRVASRGGAGLAVAGGALAAVGATRAVHHGRLQNKQAALAQTARRERNAQLAAS